MLTTRTALLLSGLALLALIIARLTLGPVGAAMALGLSLLAGTAAYWSRRRATLRLLGGRKLLWYEAPEQYDLTAQLARRAGLPAPELYLLPGAQANAVAVANAHSSAVGVTAPLLEHLSADEVAAVVAHEIAHIRNGDLLLAMVASSLAGAAVLLAEVGRWGLVFGWLMGMPVPLGAVLVALLVAAGVPAIAMMLRMAISRERELLADMGAVRLTGAPERLARALWRLEQVNSGTWWQRLLGLARSTEPKGWARLFASHPPMEQRIARLLRMARDGGAGLAPAGLQGDGTRPIVWVQLW